MTDEVQEQTPAPVDVNELRAKIESEYRSKFEEERNKILSNKEQILEEKRQLEQRFKGYSEEDFAELSKFKQQKEADEMTKLLAEGRIEEATQRLMRSQLDEWNKERSQFEERFNKAHEERDTLAGELEQLREKNATMRKQQYLKDLTGTDDSFKKEYFGDFFDLYSKRAQFDEETGAVYALGADNKRLIDNDGNFVTFDKFYQKQKLEHGLFWNGGSGSGKRGAGGSGDALGNDPRKWSHEDKMAYMKENGREAYAQLLAKAHRK